MALKCAESRIDDAAIRLLDEAKILATLQHPAIPTLEELVLLQGARSALVMEFVDGVDLSTLVRETGPFPVQALAGLLEVVAGALHSAARSGVVHRDVKPANLMLDRAGAVRLLDFGIARARVHREARTATGMLIGTARYMAPEAFESEPTTASDVFALGLTALRLRRVPLDAPMGLQRGEAFERAREEALTAAALPEEFTRILRATLTRDAAHRIDAQTLAGALREAYPDGVEELQTWSGPVVAERPAPPPSDDPMIGTELRGVPYARTRRQPWRLGMAITAGFVIGVVVALIAGLLVLVFYVVS